MAAEATGEEANEDMGISLDDAEPDDAWTSAIDQAGREFGWLAETEDETDGEA